MQRVLSGERARCVESSEEFITKKLCISFIIICAFFSLLGGFFLGRYAFERSTTVSTKAFVEHKLHLEILNDLSICINKINNLTNELSQRSVTTRNSFNYSKLHSKLRCSSDFKVGEIPDLEHFKSNVNVDTNEIIMTDLDLLQRCYNNISSFLESELVPD